MLDCSTGFSSLYIIDSQQQRGCLWSPHLNPIITTKILHCLQRHSHCVNWSLSRVHKAYWCRLEFTLFRDVVHVCSSHRLVGLSRIHIVQWSGIEFTLFSGVVWSSHCSMCWFGVIIAQWGGLEITLFSGVVWSSHCSVVWCGVCIV